VAEIVITITEVEDDRQVRVQAVDGEDFTDAEADTLASAALVELDRIRALRATKAYPVHVKPATRVERSRTYDLGRGSGPTSKDEDGVDYRELEETVPDSPLFCPDCDRVLQAGSWPADKPGPGFAFLVCPRVPPPPLPEADWPCHEGCLVACGEPR